MAEATVPSFKSNDSNLSTADIYARNDDPMTRALRSNSNGMPTLEQLADLDRLSISPTDASSTARSSTTSASTSHKPSSGTKPTSFGTGYAINDYKGEGPALAAYPSSVDASHGSGSDNELDNSLLGLGDWAGPRQLRGAGRAQKRVQLRRHSKQKKPEVVLHQHTRGATPDLVDNVESTRAPKQSDGNHPECVEGVKLMSGSLFAGFAILAFAGRPSREILTAGALAVAVAAVLVVKIHHLK